MQPTSRVTLDRIEGNEKSPPRARVVFDNHATGTQIDGAVLEAAVSADHRHLLFVTDDVPYEETLGIYLLNAEHAVLDTARLGSPYTTGAFSGLRIIDEKRLAFRFFGETEWTLTLFDQPRMRIPFFPEARGVSRPFGFTRRFRIDGEPKPQG